MQQSNVFHMSKLIKPPQNKYQYLSWNKSMITYAVTPNLLLCDTRFCELLVNVLFIPLSTDSLKYVLFLGTPFHVPCGNWLGVYEVSAKTRVHVCIITQHLLQSSRDTGQNYQWLFELGDGIQLSRHSVITVHKWYVNDYNTIFYLTKELQGY